MHGVDTHTALLSKLRLCLPTGGLTSGAWHRLRPTGRFAICFHVAVATVALVGCSHSTEEGELSEPIAGCILSTVSIHSPRHSCRSGDSISQGPLALLALWSAGSAWCSGSRTSSFSTRRRSPKQVGYARRRSRLIHHHLDGLVRLLSGTRRSSQSKRVDILKALKHSQSNIPKIS